MTEPEFIDNTLGLLFLDSKGRLGQGVENEDTSSGS